MKSQKKGNKSVTKLMHILLTALLTASLSIFTLQAQEFDILLKGGHVIDPKNEIDEKMDVAITGNTITQVAVNIPSSSAKTVIDVSGLYVTPGLIDLHAHVFQGNNPDESVTRSLPPDGFTFRAGVTTVVDAGTSGWRTFRNFKKEIEETKPQTRILAFLNIVGIGMVGRYDEQNVADMNPVMTAHMINRLYPDIIVGIKSPHYWGDFTQVDLAVKAGNLANVPVMVDFGERTPTNPLDSLFMKHLRPGDIFTHTYSRESRGREAVVNEQTGTVKPFVFEAQKRGIVFDVGHGGGAFTFQQAIPAIAQGFYPNSISSDMHDQSVKGAFKDMANLLSKFMAMGMSLQDVILRATWSPANIIKRPDLGNLSVGAEADVAVFRLHEGDFGYMDVRRSKIIGKQKLEAELTIRAGRVVWDLNGRAVPLFVNTVAAD